jgi:hypothetical protein
VKEAQDTIRLYVKDVAEVWATLAPAHGDQAQRATAFEALGERFHASADVVRQQMAGVMRGFARAPTQKVQPSPLLCRMLGEVIRSRRQVDVLPFWFQVGQGRPACWAGS